MQKRSWFQRLLRWVGIIVGVAALFALGYYAAQSGVFDAFIGGTTAQTPAQGPGGMPPSGVPGAPAQSGAAQVQSVDGTMSTVTVRSADSAVGVVSAAGNLALANEQQIVVQVSGIVSQLPVKVGDMVEEGDLLVVLDSTEAERAVEEALLSVSTAQYDYNDKVSGGSDLELAAAEASLRSAQENLADVLAGPSQQEIAAAQASLTSAQASYADLQAGPSAAELTQLATAMRKAEVAVAEAQTSYDQIAWQNNAGMTSQAAALQSATLDYENALAAYEQATAPATTSELQSALSNIQSAQESLDNLLRQPTAASIADAEAQVATAESNLKLLQAGGDASAIAGAQATLAQAQMNLNNAVADLAKTEIRAPMAGTILSLALSKGQQVSSGTTAATIADVADLELTVNVAEVDIQLVEVGQLAAIALDALPGQSFEGRVSQIAPSSDPASGVVNYPVTIQLTDDNLRGVRSGMTAVATLRNQEEAAGWLVPSNAVRDVNGQSQITLVRNGTTQDVTVTTGAIQGEWVVVQSNAIQAGDQVVGSVTTLVNENTNIFMGGPAGGAAPAGGGPPGGGMRP